MSVVKCSRLQLAYNLQDASEGGLAFLVIAVAFEQVRTHPADKNKTMPVSFQQLSNFGGFGRVGWALANGKTFQ